MNTATWLNAVRAPKYMYKQKHVSTAACMLCMHALGWAGSSG